MRNPIKNKVVINITSVMIAITVFLLAGIYQSWWHHNLYNNGNWTSSKLQLKKGVMGSVSFMVTHFPLADNHLNLGAWFGFQEVLLKKPLNPEYVACSFQLDSLGQFYFIFNKTDTGFYGIRISDHPMYENAFFKADPSGKFIRYQRLEVPNVSTNKWEKFRAEFDSNVVKIFVEDTLIANLEVGYLQDQIIGFRGGERDVLIDDVIVKSKNDEDLFKDSFNNKHALLKSLIVSIGAGLVTFVILYSFQFSLLTTISYIVFLLTCAAISFSICYWNILQYQYPKSQWLINWYNYKSTIESEQDIINKIVNNQTDDNSEQIRVVFVGSSQTWGAGASSEDKTFVRQFEKMINIDTVEKKYHCINFGAAGLTSNQLLINYKNLLDRLNPTLTVLNLANNDISADSFKANLETFISLNKANGIKSVFILYSNESNNALLMKNHAIVKQVAHNLDIPFIDMHSYLLSMHNKGFLWWDFVHLSDFGQYLFAEELKRELFKHKTTQVID